MTVQHRDVKVRSKLYGQLTCRSIHKVNTHTNTRERERKWKICEKLHTSLFFAANRIGTSCTIGSFRFRIIIAKMSLHFRSHFSHLIGCAMRQTVCVSYAIALIHLQWSSVWIAVARQTQPWRLLLLLWLKQVLCAEAVNSDISINFGAMRCHNVMCVFNSTTPDESY